MSASFRICEIYMTIMGESSASGWPCTIIRMGGCNLNCRYCDTAYAKEDYQKLTIWEILKKVRGFYPQRILVTGGEPLIQPDTPGLIKYLLTLGHIVYLETNGSMDISPIDKRAVKIIDLKCPTSGECHRNYYQNLEYLTPKDEVKFVISNREDFLWACEVTKRYQIPKKAICLYSPVDKIMEPGVLADWILKENMEVRFQLQFHKILWGARRGI